MIMQNYMNGGLAPGQMDPNSIMQWLQQNGYDAGPMMGGGPLALPPGVQNMTPGAGPAVPGVHYDPTMAQGGPQGQMPAPGQPLKPNAALTGWDGVNDKLRFLAQRAKMNRLSAPGEQASGTGGGGGGFGQLFHSIFGGGGG